ncbi:DUF4136 domain-containing protein [Rapidithrix thailandica]|uniref:DUF4136 domain-containing protein n=1 Tax=Rapidithrix thailandica TaxID=413964 RepID=A0AAW9SFZ1_9BACT
MKLSTSLFALLALALASCMNYNEYLVESDYSYQGKFKNYRSYKFINQISAVPDSSIYNPIIEDAIAYRMKLQGYRMDDSKPNLLVSYKIFFNDLEFRGYNQPKIEYWVKTENDEEAYDPIEYDLKRGTLLILFFDRKREKVVWQGYASGVFGNKYFDNNRYLKRAVRSIFDQYQFLAEGFMVERKGN